MTHHAFRHTLGYLNEGLRFANLTPGQRVQATADALQLACIGKPQHRGLGHAGLREFWQPQDACRSKKV